MKKRISEFCATQDVNHRWYLLCQIESMLECSNKVATRATFVGCLFTLPFFVITWLKILWSVGFMMSSIESPIRCVLSEIGFISWGVIGGGLIVACLGPSIIIAIVYKIRLSFCTQTPSAEIRGSDAWKAKEIAKKAKKLTCETEGPNMTAATLLVLGGVAAVAITHGIDQALAVGEPAWSVPIKIIISLLPLTIPVGLSGVVCSFIVILPIWILLNSIDLSELKRNADKEWVRLDPTEAEHRAAEEERVTKAAQAARRTDSLHTPIPSYSSYSPDKGLNTYMSDSRNGQTIYFKDGQYVNEDGERVPLQYIDE